MGLTLRYKINGAIIITFLVIAIVFTAIQLPFQKNRLQTAVNSIEILLQTLVERDMEQLANEIFDTRLNALDLRLKQMKKVKGILAIAVFDTSGKPMVLHGSGFADQSIESKELENIRQHSQIQKIQYQGQASMLFSQKISFLEEHLGFIRIYYSLKDVNHNQRLSFLIFASLLFSILLVMLIILNLLLSKAILNPIKYLRDAAKIIAKGNLEQKINLSRNDEIGSLAASFMEMQESIKQTILSLEKENYERKRVESALRESEDKFSKYFYLSPDAISITSRETGIFIDVNQNYIDLLGYERDELIGRSIMEFGIWKNSSERETMLKEFRKTGRLQAFEAEGRTKSGIILTVEISSEIIELNGKKCLLAIVRDISDRKKTQEMMIQSEKMLSVGGLAAGMAHEINNPLAGVMQSANVIENRLIKNTTVPANEKAAEDAGTTMESIHSFMEARSIPRMLQTIRDSGQRMAKIVENMLSFARRSEADISSCDMAELLDKTLELAGTDYDLKKEYDFKKIKIKKDYDDNLPKITCERSKIQQVLLNILKNGAHSMQEDIKNNKEKILYFVLRLKCEADSNMVRIEIEDNGPGMDEKTSKRIFEPFFTTKPVGVGTGLGLSVSYFIITENHKGKINVKSTLGQGTTFIIQLPIDRL
ncbi:MAG: PAS domain S-box protein [Desulfobacula sp.]|nr:PAS domain S-box protein [Desulfobacula sp.]